MKKVFSVNVHNKTPERQLDSIRHEIKKYLARERRKALPENVDFWDFDCKFGNDAASAEVIKVEEIKDSITKFAKTGRNSFYIEILAKHGHKPKRK